MEAEGDRSIPRQRPQGSVIFADGSIRAEWASLQPDLVQLIADYLLSTSGVDEYMAMRAVCPTWRSAVAKPSPHAAVADPRFRPRQWVLLNGRDDDQGRPLFLNVATGRFRRLRLPLLRDYIFVAASDGLLVLGARDRPHAARLLNPLTGDMLPFAVPMPREIRFETAVTGSKPTIIFSVEPGPGGSNAVYSADPTGQRRVVKFHDAFLTSKTMVTYEGDVFVLSLEGTLCKIVWLDGHWYGERILQTGINCTSVLAVCSGKLLLVKEGFKTIKVFSIDVKRKVLEPIKSLGSSALFLSHGNCMVVDADMLPSIERNCIYSTFFMTSRFDGIYAWCDLTDGKKSYITAPQVGGDCHGPGSGIIHEGPLSLAMALLTPIPNVKAQLDRIRQT